MPQTPKETIMTTDLSWSGKLRPEVSERWDELIQLRREFHRMPELSFKEHRTVARIKDWLAAQGVENVTSVTETGVVALIEGAQPGRTIMYRADIDALPVEEDSGVDYPSEHPGVMHACGHDGHVAIALMLASMLNTRRESLQGNVKVVFQPAEEVGGGAEPMIDAGVMEHPHVDAVLGVHMAAMMHVGTLGVTPGPTMAGTGTFQITVQGSGGHAAMPHRAADPIVIAAQIVSSVQTIVSRNVDPQQSAVVTIGTIHGGTKENIIPDTVEMTGTIRAFSSEILDEMGQRIVELSTGVARSMGADADATYSINSPPVVNDAAFADRVRRHARRIVSEDSIVSPMLSVADDMARFLEIAPGCYYLLGAATEEHGIQGHHQGRFAIDDRSLALGLELSLRVIDGYLGE